MSANTLHPAALILAMLLFLVLVFIVTASSYQKHKLRLLATSALHPKRKTDKRGYGSSHSEASSSTRLPTFCIQAAESGDTRLIKRWLNATTIEDMVQTSAAENYTAAHYAAKSGHPEVLKLLLSKGGTSMANAIDENGISPLHLAALSGHGLCVKVLLDAGSDPSAVDRNGQTAVGLAERSANFGCARLIQRSVASTINLASVNSSNMTQRKPPVVSEHNAGLNSV